MGDSHKYVVNADGNYGVLPNGKWAFFNTAGNACDCCPGAGCECANCAGDLIVVFAGIEDLSFPPTIWAFSSINDIPWTLDVDLAFGTCNYAWDMPQFCFAGPEPSTPNGIPQSFITDFKGFASIAGSIANPDSAGTFQLGIELYFRSRWYSCDGPRVQFSDTTVKFRGSFAQDLRCRGLDLPKTVSWFDNTGNPAPDYDNAGTFDNATATLWCAADYYGPGGPGFDPDPVVVQWED